MADFVSFVIILIALSILFTRKSLFKNPQWPSVPRVPFLGSIPWINGRKFPMQCIEWHKKYGPIFSYKPGLAPEIIVVSGARLTKELFVKNSPSFEFRYCPFFYADELKLEDHFTPLLNTSAAILHQRRVIAQAIKAGIGSGNDVGVQCAAVELINYIRSTISPKEGIDVGLNGLIEEAAGLSALSIGFGLQWTIKKLRECHEAQSLFSAVHKYFAYFNWVDDPSVAFPCLSWILFRRSRRIKNSAKLAADELLGSYQALFNITCKKVKVTGLDSLNPSVAQIVLSKDDETTQYRKTILCGSTTTAAFSTTADVLKVLIGTLAAFPEWQSSIRRELDELADYQLRDSMFSDAPPVFRMDKGKQNFPVTRAFLDETMRAFPIFPINTRVASKDFTLCDGRKIKSGQCLFTLPMCINHDPEMFEDPHEFNPRRFLKAKESIPSWYNFRHASFGSGRRSCPGAALAEYSLFNFLCQLVYSFQFRYENGKTGVAGINSTLVGLECHYTFPKVFVTPRARTPMST
ncbi:cytochrome P450 monooxygenase [Phakopsora pachyrhizi]|uniref:Cytochrome P450 monooxygenase n=1 Tax=Phakopsora pachyrhizi TaxID=170000 RepID=A0AAV0B7N7_PHAPC|nr:cytochrome P450 monooxygenase [Phakopsora pachyrhizi]CAH7682376.1 cytochrome P450 monooxygenase [Phakopsora pachyrhizi]